MAAGVGGAAVGCAVVFVSSTKREGIAEGARLGIALTVGAVVVAFVEFGAGMTLGGSVGSSTK